MTNTIKWLLVIDIAIILLCLTIGENNWLYSTQISFWSSSLVIGASMLSYQRVVFRSLENGAAIPDDDRDMLDKMEDPYNLYGEDEPIESTDSSESAEFQEKTKPAHRTTLEALKNSKGALSFYRLGSYILLFIGFFYLSSNEILHIPSYLISLALPIIIIVTLLMTKDGGIYEESS